MCIRDRSECGTVACAAGHLVRIESPHEGESWLDFIGRITGVTHHLFSWDWLFAQVWVHTDNTAFGASKRIRYFLEKGVPENWGNQMRGGEPLCY